MTVIDPDRLFFAHLFHFDGERWQRLTKLPGYPRSQQISPEGIVWIRTNQNELSRFDGNEWQHYGEQDYVHPPRMQGRFTLAGEEAWGAAAEGAFYFDGQEWTAFPGTLAGGSRGGVEGESGVWMIGPDRNLSHIDKEGGRMVIDLREALPNVSWDPAWRRTLVQTPDGALWLDPDGLWRFDGATWQEVRPGGERLQGQLIGATSDRVWTWDGYDLSWVAFDDVSDGGLVSLPADQESIALMVLAPDGTARAIVRGEMESGQVVFSLVSLLVLGIGVLIFMFVVMGRSLKSMSQSQTQVREVVRRATSDLPGEQLPPAQETRSRKRLVLGYLGLALLFVLLYPVVDTLVDRFERVWPDAPDWVTTVLMLAVMWIIVSLGKRRFAILRTSHDQAPSSLGQDLRQGAKLIAFYIIFCAVHEVVLDDAAERLLSWTDNLAFNSLVLVALALFLLIAPGVIVLMFPFYWVLAPLRRADYAGALRRVRLLRRLRPSSAMFLYLHGTVHLFAGEYQEAEARLRESLDKEQKSGSVTASATMENLGYALAGQGRYEEAVRIIEGAIEITPGGGGPYVALAGIYLRQGVQAERALDLLAQAQENKSSSLLNRRIDRYRWAEIWANRAWALTLQGRHIEAAEALEQAFEKRDRKFKPGLADLHCRMGKVMRLRDDKAAAIEHWRQAQQIDPQGEAGRWATRLLQELT
jgi:tetratricopeptide (TPR) repeat protein